MKVQSFSVIGDRCIELFYFKVENERGKLQRKDKEFLKQLAREKVEISFPYVSASYAYPYVVFCFSLYKVSVDIECFRKMKSSYACIFTSKYEIDYFQNKFNELSTDELLTVIWTTKEAIGKYFGVGLKYGFDSIRIRDNRFNISKLVRNNEKLPKVYLFGYCTDFAITIAYYGKIEHSVLNNIKSEIGLKSLISMTEGQGVKSTL
jgi:phosphopantetheinyl transferase